MVFLRSSVAAMSLLVAACSSTSRPVRSGSSASESSPDEVVAQVDLSKLPRLDGRLDEALHGATAVVLGIRRIEDSCGTYFDMRMFPEVHLGGRDPSEPYQDYEHLELRGLLVMPNSKAECGEPQTRTIETNQIKVGDRVVVALGTVPSTRETPKWKRTLRIIGIAPLEALPKVAAIMPPTILRQDSEQFLPIPRMPGFGTPASLRLLGSKRRFEVQGEEIIDRVQGIVWQANEAKYKMSFEEATLYCEAQRTGGRDDWRLPTAAEMHGLFLPSIPRPAVVDSKLFPAPPDELFWTRTDDDGPWVGSLHEGILISTHYDDPSPYGNYHVRCVRPGQMLATEMVDRFAEIDGVLLDALSDTRWHLGSQSDGVTHEVAQNYCRQGTFGGLDEWRLPGPQEAFVLMSACPDALANWESKAEDIWTSMMDPEHNVGGTFRPCNLYRSVPLAAIFDSEGVNGKNPVARVMCTRNARSERASEPTPCLVGSEFKNAGNFSICEEKGVRHGPYLSSWSSGGMFEKATYDHGVREGMSVMYHELGSIYSRGDYVKGKLHGEVWAKRPTGRFLFKGAYKNGLPAGRWTFFDPQGREVEYVDMVDGKSGPGQYVRYGDKGEKLLECPTLAGWEHGTGRIFDRDSGKIDTEQTYRAGWLEGPLRTMGAGKERESGQNYRDEAHGEWITKNAEGKVTRKDTFYQGKFDGVQEVFDDRGKLISSRRYRAGAPIGTWTTTASDGTIQERGEIDDEGTGTVTSYSNGQVHSEEHFVRGKKHGISRRYYGPQQKEREEEYRDGYLVQSTTWFEDGKIREKATYSVGKAHGSSERYDMSGRLISRGNYQQGLREGHWEFMTPTGRRFEADFVKGKAVNVTEGTGGLR